MHKAIIIGRLGQDPTMRYTPNGNAVTSFSLASDNKRNGEDNTEWFNCSAWGKLADICEQYLTKGSQVYVEGLLTKREYETRDGEKRSSLDVNVNIVQFLSSGNQLDGEIRDVKVYDKALSSDEVSQTYVDGVDDLPF